VETARELPLSKSNQTALACSEFFGGIIITTAPFVINDTTKIPLCPNGFDPKWGQNGIGFAKSKQ